MQSTLHKLVEDVFDEQELAVILNLAFLQISDLETAVKLTEHMKSFNGGWARPLARTEKVREGLRALISLADKADSFSFKPMLNDATAASEAAFHNAVILTEIHAKTQDG